LREILDGLGWRRGETSAIRYPENQSTDALLDFSENTVPALRVDGWEVEIDPSLDLRILEVDGWSGGWTEAKGGWFDLKLGIEVAGARLDLLDICREAMSSGGLEAILARLRDGLPLLVSTERGILRLPADRMRPIFDALAFLAHGEESSVPALVAAQLGEMGIEPGHWQGTERFEELRAKLVDSVTAPQAVALPAGVKATLRPYQADGLAWLQWLRSNGFGGVLADDMGLGKTLQTICHIACEHGAGRLVRPVLILCPTSLASNWQDECARFAPFLEVTVLHGADRREHREAAERADVVITTYPLLSRDEEWLTGREWHMLVLDEAQTLKNSKALARKVVARLAATHRMALTGTPLENHLGELWSLFDLVQPGLLGSDRHFTRHVRPRIELHGDDALRERLRGVVAPFMLRRTKSRVVLELPEKTEIVQRLELQGKQRDLYETIRAVQDERLRSLLDGQGFERSTITVLDALLRIRQVCCDPRLLPAELSQGCRESAKLEWLAEAVPEMVEEGRRILVFSQFTALLELVEPILKEASIGFARLDGSTGNRGEVVKSFQDGSAPVFLLSLKAGGTGLNLTSADTVIFLDPWWNPAAESQAMDRAHRMGQKRAVFVYRLVAQGTVEERILSMQARKSALAASILEGGGAASVAFTSEELAELLKPLGPLV
jgi:SNF2 family DNA or RNA helicase